MRRVGMFLLLVAVAVAWFTLVEPSSDPPAPARARAAIGDRAAGLAVAHGRPGGSGGAVPADGGA